MSSSIPGWAILPLRLFLGISFLAAGWDKLTDPAFLDPSARDYIGQQIGRFAPGTPLEGFLLNFAVPNASLFGVMVMGGELCIGIAVLLGLLTRFSAAMGLLLNLTFFLSATWDVHPFYFGADLPYSLAWLTLLLAGPGPLALDVLIKKWLSPPPITYVSRGRTVTVEDSSTAMTRRAFLGAGAVGVTGLMLAATGLGWGIVNLGKRAGTVANIPPTTPPTPQIPTVAPTAVPQDTKPTGQGGGVANPATQEQPTVPPAEPTPTAASAGSGLQLIAGPNDVPVNQSLDFTLSDGYPAVLVHNDSGYSAYIAICTHEGCQVSYFPSRKVLSCPCHGAQFDAANGGQVLRGPARRPLSPLALTIGPDGSVYLAG
jgi:thiosulfate dehydrogenase [quinone] large subunit